jgi:16S rRNA A1518/A1519 N6-dimethyltransferase RsmA/KsgA/DIM1 with predicted DNA glycosylase/AP lyase activity
VRQLWIPPADDATAVLADVGIDPTMRPETIDPGTFLRLFRQIERFAEH